MSSRTQGDRGTTEVPVPSVTAEFPPDLAATGPVRAQDHRRRARWPVVLLTIALLLSLAASGYLLAVARAWQERADSLEGTGYELGEELARTRADLEESRSTLALVESQLDGAQEQIHELADAVAQTGDDREVQRQVAEYQAQVLLAASAVTASMDECIASQETLITHLEEAARPRPTPSATPGGSPTPDPDATAEPEPTEPAVDLAQLRSEAAQLCAIAADANRSLQERLGDG